MKPGLRAATWLYRWNLSAGIIGVVFSVLTFAAVFSLFIGGATSLAISATLVLVLFFGLGTFLDKVARFWRAQATVGTVRNQYLIDTLYEKEFLLLKYSTLPQMYALRVLLNDPRAIVSIDESINRLEQTLRDKKWTIESGENVYE
jgi:hypothetical protein